MALTQLAKSQWQSFFDRVSRAFGPKRVEIEVSGLGLGHQIEADWIPLLGLSYDPKNDVLIVTAESIEHWIRHPKQIHIDQDMQALHSIEAVDADNNRHIILLKDALSLPAP
jgi:hypothetical protein